MQAHKTDVISLFPSFLGRVPPAFLTISTSTLQDSPLTSAFITFLRTKTPNIVVQEWVLNPEMSKMLVLLGLK